MVVDIDVKDDGLLEFKKYIEEHGDINTFIVETPTGGFHYYFNYSHADPEQESYMRDYLKTATKFRDVGIDIRSEGGYVVAPPSLRNGLPYKIINNAKPIDMPSELISFLIVGRSAPLTTVSQKREAKQYVRKDNIKYDLTTELVKDILQKAGDKYLNDYHAWLKMTTALRCHDLYSTCKERSQQRPHYDAKKDENHWRYNRGKIDLNFIIKQLRKEGINLEPARKYKEYIPITKDVSNIKKINLTQNILATVLPMRIL